MSDTDSDTQEHSTPDLKDVQRTSKWGKLLAWKWLFTILFTIVGGLAVLAYFIHTGVIGTDASIVAHVDASSQLNALLWVVVGTIAAVSLVAIVRIAGVRFVNSVIDVLDSIRFER